MIKTIVAVDKDFGIGYQGNLLIPIRADLKRFKKLTVGNILVYGSATMETYPRKAPLKDRLNIILSKTMRMRSLSSLASDRQIWEDPASFEEGIASLQQYFPSTCLLARSMEDLFSYLQILQDHDLLTDVFIGGGATVYEEMLPYCDRVLFTVINRSFPADKHFPKLFSMVEETPGSLSFQDLAPGWEKISEGPWELIDPKNDPILAYKYYELANTQVKPWPTSHDSSEG